MNAITPIQAKITPDFVPSTEAETLACLASWEWRIFSGQLYKIMVKEDGDDGEGFVLPFKPNANQIAFLKEVHYRNIILKARQLGFTTLIAILWLDHALFVADQQCCMIAHTLDHAKKIFRTKVKFAYRNLPEKVRAMCPVEKQTEEEIIFGHNNSSITVTSSARSGTYHRMHISELGKIAAKFPTKAEEVKSGSLPAVPKTGIAVIESTAEGQEGVFYDMATAAERVAQTGAVPTIQQFKFHFFPWWKEPGYILTEAEREGIIITPEMHEYFDKIELEMNTKLCLGQRAWYVSKRDNDFAGDHEMMWREMPSSPEECWRRSIEGKFYTRQLAAARAQGRITQVPHVSNVLCHTFWDIGAGDGTGIWIMQHIGPQERFLRYIEGWDEGYAHYVKALRETGWLFGRHYLPHDAAQVRQMANKVGAPIDILRELAPDWTFEIVPVVQTIQHGIQMTKEAFSRAWFDEEGCKAGLEHLELYGKKWNARLGVWSHEPEKMAGHSEAADSFRQWAQGYDPRTINAPTRIKRRPQGGMAA